jgi:hypothetical protein
MGASEDRNGDIGGGHGRDPLRTVLAVLVLPLSIGLALLAMAATLAVAARKLAGRFGAGRP